MKIPRTIPISIVLAMGFASAPAMADTWGSSYSLGPSTSRIYYAKTTHFPGHRAATPDSESILFLWQGLSNGLGHHIQTTMEAWRYDWCGASCDQWVVHASAFGESDDTPLLQKDGDYAPVSADDQVTIEYELQSDNDTWVQTVTLRGL